MAERILMTPGQQVLDAILKHVPKPVDGKYELNAEQLEAVGKELGIEPITETVPDSKLSDWELWQLAEQDAQATISPKWSPNIETILPFFVKRFHERDKEHSESKVSEKPAAKPMVKQTDMALLEEACNKFFSVKEYVIPVGAKGLAEFLRLVRARDGEPLEVTSSQIRQWWSETSVNGYARWDKVALKINAHRGVVPAKDDPLEVTEELYKQWTNEWSNLTGTVPRWDLWVIAKINAHRGVVADKDKPLAVTADWLKAKWRTVRTWTGMAEQINAYLGVQACPQVTAVDLLHACDMTMSGWAGVADYLNAKLRTQRESK